MSCNCNTADPNCEPCAFCTPPGVKCLPDCNPQDPCPEKLDLCCVSNTTQDYPCSDISNGQPLCETIIKIFEAEFPESVCCALEMSIDLLADPPITTTTSTTSTTTTTTTASPTSTTTSTTSTTTTTTSGPQELIEVGLCQGDTCFFACSCEIPLNFYVSSLPIVQNTIIYTNQLGTGYAPAGYYSYNGVCYQVSGNFGQVSSVSTCSATGTLNISLDSLIVTDKITNITYNNIPVVLNSGTFPIVAGNAAVATVLNPGSLGVLRIFQNINSTQPSNLAQTIVNDSNGSLLCANPSNGVVNYQIFNVDIDNVTPASISVISNGVSC